MGLWIALFITFVVIGSVLWVKPSPREKMLSEYRRQALSKGLKVRLLDEKLAQQLFPWIDNYRAFVFYEKSLPGHAKPSSPKPLVIRLSDNPNAHELDGVDPVFKELKEKLGLSLLPETAEALVVSAAGIALLWKEYAPKQGNVCLIEDINNFLQQVIVLHKIWQ